MGRPLPDHVEGLKPVFLDFLNNIERETETIKQRLGKDPDAVIREFLRRRDDRSNNQTERHRWKEKTVEYIAQTLGERIFFTAPRDPNSYFYKKFHIRIYDSAWFFTENRILILTDKVVDKRKDIHHIILSDVLYRDILYVRCPKDRYSEEWDGPAFLIVPERFSFLSEEFRDEAAFRGDKRAISDKYAIFYYSTDYIERKLNKAFKSPGLWFVFRVFELARFLRDFGSIPNKDTEDIVHNQLSQAMAAFMRRMLDGRLGDARKRWDTAVEEWARYVEGERVRHELWEKERERKQEIERKREEERARAKERLWNAMLETQPKRKSAYYNKCFRCKRDVHSDTNPQCPVCHWLICRCGACGCSYTGPLW